MGTLVKRSQSQSGSALLAIMILVAAVSISTFAYYSNFTSSDLSSVSVFNRKNILYVSESTRAIAIQIAQDYLMNNKTPTTDGMTNALATQLPPLMPSGFTAQDFQAEIVSQAGASPIASGPFKGMLAPQTVVKFQYRVASASTGASQVISSSEAVVSLAQIGLFQFMYFIDQEQAGFNPGPQTTVDGRMHANGDLCLAGSTGLTLKTVTAAGRIMHSRRTDPSECGIYGDDNKPYDKTFVSVGGDMSVPALLKGGATPSGRGDNGCTDCDGTLLKWKDFATQRWMGSVQDSAQGVPKLSLPLPKQTYTQIGASGLNPWVGHSNATNLRFMVDPIVGGESPDSLKYKYAYNADIRIIDGIWYLKDKLHPEKWPGKPIWSDHPKSFKDPRVPTSDVGQVQLAALLGWGASVPKRFSYYDYNQSAQSLTGDTHGVISYGGLVRTAAADRVWIPGHVLELMPILYNPDGTWRPPRSGKVMMCGIPSWGDGTTELTNPDGAYAYTDPLHCTNGVNPPVAGSILDSTRWGFVDPHIESYYSGVSSNGYNYNGVLSQWYRSNVAPMNFDIYEFQEALKDTTPGELGSYFTPSGYMGRPFNGIVFISLTWPGSEDGYSPSGQPTLWPLPNVFHGQTPDNMQAGRTTNTAAWSSVNQLPYELCSEDPPPGPWQPWPAFDTGSSGDVRFRIPPCQNYYPNDYRPTVVRFFNGATLDPAVLPQGLSLVSNQSVYVMGDMNSSSKVTSATDTPWIPFLIAGDQVNFLSNAFEDRLDRWDLTVPTDRVASNTTYNVSLLTGWAMGPTFYQWSSSETLNSLPGLIEDWSGKTLNMSGSIVVGFYPVYNRAGHYMWTTYRTYRAPNRQIKFDPHLTLSGTQPPGSPSFFISSVQNWKTQ